MYVYICMSLIIYLYVYIYVYIYINIWKQQYLYIHTYIYVYVHKYVYIYTHIYIYACMSECSSFTNMSGGPEGGHHLYAQQCGVRSAFGGSVGADSHDGWTG